MLFLIFIPHSLDFAGHFVAEPEGGEHFHVLAVPEQFLLEVEGAFGNLLAPADVGGEPFGVEVAEGDFSGTIDGLYDPDVLAGETLSTIVVLS